MNNRMNLTERQRAELGAEDVLWCGKSRPTPFLRGMWQRVLSACLGAAFVVFYFATSGASMAASVFKGESKYPFVDALIVLVFSLLGVTQLWLLLTPLYYWIRSKFTTWVVTNQRVISFFGSSVRSWWRTDWLDPVRVEERSSGCSDFLFTTKRILCCKHGEVRVRTGIENIPREEADVLYGVFRSLQKKNERTKSVSHEERMKNLLDDFYHPIPSQNCEVGEYY